VKAIPEELEDLSSEIPVKNNSKLLNLHPFLDKDVLIRVGRRLREASNRQFAEASDHLVTQVSLNKIDC
jgi:hypothetical protein